MKSMSELSFTSGNDTKPGAQLFLQIIPFFLEDNTKYSLNYTQKERIQGLV